MYSRSLKLFALGIGILAAASYGCSSPWGTAARKSTAPPIATAASRDALLPSAPISQADAAATEPDMSAVLDKLQQVREIDPAAEQKLLDELRRTPSKSWPLVAEQFRASLAYHERLAARSQRAQRKGTATVDPMVMETGYDEPRTLSTGEKTLADASRPSEPIGTLVDPRKAEADGVSSEAMAKATPYSTPGAIPQLAQNEASAPKEFIASGSVQPISSERAAVPQNGHSLASRSVDPAVMPTRLETVDDRIEPKTDRDRIADNSDWQQHVKRAADDLSQRVAASPATTAEVHQHASLRMLWLLAGDTERALEPIPHISPAEQDYWSRQLFSLATYLDHHSQPDDKRRAAASVTHLDEALANLREVGSLSLRNLTFCKNVYGYGSFEPFASEQFSPGQHVSLYVEVENYHSESKEKGFCTFLGSTYELLDADGERIAGGEFPDVEDCCRSRRRDFHIQYGLALPEKIEPGRYQLQLVMKDRQSDKIGHATASFEIRGNRTVGAPTSILTK